MKLRHDATTTLLVGSVHHTETRDIAVMFRLLWKTDFTLQKCNDLCATDRDTAARPSLHLFNAI